MPDAQQPARATEQKESESILRETVAALWTALWQVRVIGTDADVGALLPPISALSESAKAEPREVIRRTDRIVRIFVCWRRQRCFYRSFAAACVLRRRGIPAKLNFGLQVTGHRRERCHCWITIDDRVLAEAGDPRLAYPVPLGESRNDVQYWLAVETDSQPAA